MKTLQTIEKPIWQDVETKTRLMARFVYDDGSANIVSFPVDEENEDYKLFLTHSSHDQADTNTQEIRDEQAANREKSVAQNTEKADQKRANALFNAKIEAFEMPIVQNASKAWKAKIRKASTTVEVVAVVAALIIKEGEPVLDDADTE
jgi:hypothetical protein